MEKTIHHTTDSSPFGEDELAKIKPYAPRLKEIAKASDKLTDELALLRSKMRADGLDDRKVCLFCKISSGVLAASDYKVPFAPEAMELTLQDAKARKLKKTPTVPNFKFLGTAKELKTAIALAKERTSATGPSDLPADKAGEMLALVKAGEKPKPKDKSGAGEVSALGRIESDIANAVGDEKLDLAGLKSIVSLCQRHIKKLEDKA
tara:strand:- start:55 stop:672 length:618 start_codon:yes stop_codon:yes gene_type:complete